MQEIYEVLSNAPDFIMKTSLYMDSIDFIYKSRYFNFKIHIVVGQNHNIYCFRIVRSNYRDRDNFGGYETIFYSVKLSDIWELFSNQQQKYFAFHLDLITIHK